MEIIINDTTYRVKYGFKALMIYERIQSEAFEANSLSNIITFFYSCLLATNAEISFDEFINYLDENPDSLNEFSAYLSKVIEAQTLKKALEKESK